MWEGLAIRRNRKRSAPTQISQLSYKVCRKPTDASLCFQVKLPLYTVANITRFCYMLVSLFRRPTWTFPMKVIAITDTEITHYNVMLIPLAMTRDQVKRFEGAATLLFVSPTETNSNTKATSK